MRQHSPRPAPGRTGIQPFASAGRARRPWLLLTAVCWAALWPAISRAQNIQHTSKLADSIKRSTFRVDPSTLALNLDIPLAAFPGRGDTGLPVTFHYSSKVWRIAFVQAGDPELHTYDTLLEPR